MNNTLETEAPANAPGQQSDLLTAPAPSATISPAAPEPQSSPGSDKFDWWRDEDITVESQDSIAVYRNQRSGIVIRREAHAYDEDEDVVIVLATPEAARAVVAKMQQCLKEWRHI